jgi:DNA-binding NarL/FixJ family response regulator
MGGTPFSVVLVEDDERMSSMIATAVASDARLTLVASFDRLRTALAWLDQHAPDVLLVDLGLPDGSGLELIRTCARLHATCEIMVVSMFADEANVLASIEAGALGYVHKDAEGTDIVEAIVSLRSGGSPMSPSIARRLLTRVKSEPTSMMTRPAGASAAPALTPRETEILHLISRGYTYQEVADLLSIMMSSVQTHIKSMYRKLAVNSRSEAVFEARALGLLSDH